MSDKVISVENLSKQYRLGVISSGTFYGDVKRWWARQRGRPDPNLKVTEADHGNRDGETIWALRDVNFSVRQGETLGIIGRNGAGKSTLLKILSQVTAPTSGVVRVKGRIASLLEVGTGFHPELTGRENIYLNGAIMGMDKSEVTRKLDEIVDFSEIERFIDTPVKRYSSGMYVRLAFAVAAHLEPEILVVDEVLAVGDVQFQKKCLGKMSAVTGVGRTVLFVSHNMAAIRKLCTRAILLNQGRLTADASANATINQYLLEGSADFKPEIHLPRLDEFTGNGLKLKFSSQSGEPQAIFKLTEPWKITLEFEIYKPVKHVIAAVGITTVEAVSLATFWSKPRDLQVGKYFVDFAVNLPLKACEVQFAVGLSSFERSFYYKDNIGLVSISAVSIDEQPIRSSGAGLLLTPQDRDIRSLILQRNVPQI